MSQYSTPYIFRMLLAVMLAGVIGALTACSVLPDPPPRPQLHDFGPPPAAEELPVIPGGLVLRMVEAPAWLRGPELRYRREDHDATRVGTYTRRQWLSPPPVMIGERLTDRLAPQIAPAGEPARFRLHLRLNRFEQVFESEDSARAEVHVDALLIDTRGEHAERRQGFTVNEVSPRPDGEGAVTALTRATDRLIDELLDWLVADF